MIRTLRKQKGFSLVETLVAITVLMIVILVPLQIASQSIQTSTFSREELTATLLAEENIESVIRLRDNDALNGSPTSSWYTNLSSACKNAATGCSYNVTNGTFTSCATQTNCNLYRQTTGSAYYNHTVNGAAAFNREMSVIQSPVGEYEITSTSTWTANVLGNNTATVVVKTKIFDQYE